MTVAITCAGCRRTLRVPQDLVGQTVRCPLCIETFVAAADPVQPPPVAEKPGERRRLVAELAEPGRDEPAIALVDDESPSAEALPVGPARPSKPFKPVSFGVLFRRDPDRLFHGRAEAEISAEGLRVRLRSRRDLWVAIRGAHPARYLGGNRIAVFLDGRVVTLAVVKHRTDLDRLAHDVVAVLDGTRAELNGRGYGLPWRLALLPWLAVAVPVLAIWLRVLGGVHGGGRFLWFVVAALTFLVAFKLMRREALSNRRRAFVAATVLGCSFLLLAGAYGYRLANPTTVPLHAWRTYTPRGLRVSFLMPGEPAILQQQAVAGLPATTYTVNTYAYTLGKTFLLAVATVDRRQFPATSDSDILNARKQALQNELGVYTHERPDTIHSSSRNAGIQFVLTPYRSTSNGRETHVWRMFVVGDKVYMLCAKGDEVDADDPDVVKFLESFQVGPALGAPSPKELDGLVAHWSFDNRLDPQTHPNVDQIDGVRGRAAAFNGWSSHVSFDSLRDLNFGDKQPFSCVGWLSVRPESPPGHVLAMHGQPGVSLEVYVQNGALTAQLNTRPDAGWVPPLIGPAVNNGEWHHFALTRDAEGTVILYTDGTEVSSLPATLSTSGPLTTSWRSFGCKRVKTSVESRLTGALDEVAFLKRCLSPQEVARLARLDGP
jgi:hypothetical protein